MADRITIADPTRVGRGQPVHSGANEVGLLAPTPLAFGIAGAIALPATASAAQPAAASLPDGGLPVDAAKASTATDAPAPPPASGLIAATAPTAPDAPASFVGTGHGPTTEIISNGLALSAPLTFGVAHTQNVPAVEINATAPSVAAAPAVNEAVDAVRASADALTGALQELVARLEGPAPDAIDHVAATLDQVGQALDTVARPLLEDVGTATTDLTVGAADTVDALTGTVDTTLDALTDQTDLLLNGATDLAANAAEEVTQTLTATVDAALDGIDQLTGDVIAPATEALTGTVAAVVPAVSATADTLLDGAGKLSSTALESVDGIAGAALETVATATGSVAEGVADTIAPATALAEPVVELVTDLTGIGGSDPAGGISTLTDMLASDDGFAIVAPDAAAPVFASAGDAPEALDAITDGVTTVVDHDDGGLLDTAADIGSTLLGSEKHGLSGLFDGDHGHG